MCAELARDGRTELGQELGFQAVEGPFAPNELAVFVERTAGPCTEDPQEYGGDDTVGDVETDLGGFM